VTLDSSETVVSTYTYTAFGNTTANDTIGNPFRYVGALGYYQDSDSGLMLLGARYYDSSLGRFMTVDPIKDGTNWYGYASNEPTSQSDPGGYSAAGIGLCIGGLLAGGVMQALIALSKAPPGQNCTSNLRCNAFSGMIAGCLGSLIGLAAGAGGFLTEEALINAIGFPLSVLLQPLIAPVLAAINGAITAGIIVVAGAALGAIGDLICSNMFPCICPPSGDPFGETTFV